ncbi:MAG: DsbA family protein [Candidatus Micrarchaeota archaeon]|nr:DsbA family protein [Candidatus Micrarchaeota archaeon]
MVLCFIALGVFAVMGIFSAKYRAYSKEAFNCVIKKMTLRKCDSDLDLRMKAEIVGRLMNVNKSVAGFTNKHFELLSWLFTILMFASFAYSAFSVYNYVAFGNCNGQDSTGVCLFDPTATGQNGFTRSGGVTELKYPPTLDGHTIGNNNAEVTVIEYGCYTCPYTKKAEETTGKLLIEYKDKVKFIFKPSPVLKHPFALEAAGAAECADEQNRYWDYKRALFENQVEFRQGGIPTLKELGRGIVQNQSQFEQCIDSGKYNEKVNKSLQEATSIGIYGTPTFFIGNSTFVGNVEYDNLKNAIDEELKK